MCVCVCVCVCYLPFSLFRPTRLTFKGAKRYFFLLKGTNLSYYKHEDSYTAGEQPIQRFNLTGKEGKKGRGARDVVQLFPSCSWWLGLFVLGSPSLLASVEEFYEWPGCDWAGSWCMCAVCDDGVLCSWVRERENACCMYVCMLICCTDNTMHFPVEQC